MFILDKMLNRSAPQKLFDFVSKCKSGDDLVKKLEEDPFQLFDFIRNMNVDGNEPLAASLLYRVSPDYLENAQVKKVETTLRNKGMLNRADEPTISLHAVGSAEAIVAHKSILALASPYFEAMKDFGDFKDGKIDLKDEELSPEAYKLAVEYLYSSDEKRKDFVSTVDKALLIDIAKLSFHWQINELQKLCDDELCNSIDEFNIEKSDMDAWLTLSAVVPKFTALLGFVNRVAGSGGLESIIVQMQTPVGAAQLAVMCRPEEIEFFATLKTEFGKACQIPPGTFGKAEWEKTFPVTIEEVPPLPVNIYAILEQKDPWEPGKKLKDTCQLFLRPEKVIFKGKELNLGFDEVEELAKSVDKALKYHICDEIRYQMNNEKVEASGWVLMRKEVIPGSRNKFLDAQRDLLKGSFEVPKIMDTIFLNIITYTSTSKYLYGQGPLTYTRCEKNDKGSEIIVGGFGALMIRVFYDLGRYDSAIGLSGVWKF